FDLGATSRRWDTVWLQYIQSGTESAEGTHGSPDRIQRCL
ncbi:hypothetical protein LCGC14_1797270, partial [marine sediment metagenome]